jgi:hypothetical protein
LIERNRVAWKQAVIYQDIDQSDKEVLCSISVSTAIGIIAIIHAEMTTTISLIFAFSSSEKGQTKAGQID